MSLLYSYVAHRKNTDSYVAHENTHEKSDMIRMRDMESHTRVVKVTEFLIFVGGT